MYYLLVMFLFIFFVSIIEKRIRSKQVHKELEEYNEHLIYFLEHTKQKNRYTNEILKILKGE